MTNTVKVVTITPDGEVRDAELDADNVLAGLYEQIGCDMVDLVRLTPTLDMWLDDEGLVTGQPVNIVATWLARAFGWRHQPYFGTVVLAEHDDAGDTVSIRAELRATVREIVGL
jgi:hypothetical protein